MEPIHDHDESGTEPAAKRRQGDMIALAVLAGIALLVLLIALDLTGATPTHGG